MSVIKVIERMKLSKDEIDRMFPLEPDPMKKCWVNSRIGLCRRTKDHTGPHVCTTYFGRQLWINQKDLE